MSFTRGARRPRGYWLLALKAELGRRTTPGSVVTAAVGPEPSCSHSELLAQGGRRRVVGGPRQPSWATGHRAGRREGDYRDGATGMRPGREPHADLQRL